MSRKRKSVRKPMPKPSRPFAERKRRDLDKAIRKVLRNYHRTFIALGDE